MRSRDDPPATDAAAGPGRLRDRDQFGWFLGGQACWFAAFGIQAVLFPHLVVNVLQESPERVGIAQMCLMAPALALMVPGGMLADASDLRRLLAVLQASAMLPVLVLALLFGAGGATFGALIVFALAHGSLQAMVVPARDALLGRVAGREIQRAITTAMGVQFAAQIAGFVLAGSAGALGVPVLLCVQAALYGLGALAASRLRAVPPAAAPGTGAPRQLADLALAGREVVGSKRMGPIVLVMVGVGFFFIAVFNVVVPVMVRDLYLGGAVHLAMINGAFVAGLISASVVLMRRDPVERQGRAILLCALGGAAITAAFATHPPVVVFYALIYVFGIGAGVLMSLGRTVVQEAANERFRARVLALYSLAFLGSAPLGSLAIGRIAEATSVLTAAWLAGLGMLVLLAAVGCGTGIWAVRREAPSGVPGPTAG